MKHRKTILMIGPYSTVGGVSIHIKRVSQLLQQDYDFLFVDESPRTEKESPVFNIRSKNIFKYLGLVRKADVVHIHSGVNILRWFHLLCAFVFRKKTIVTFHTIYNLSSAFQIKINRWFLNLSDEVICVSDEIKELLKNKKAQIIPAFVPPILDKEANLPAALQSLLKTNINKKIAVSNAFRLEQHKGEDLYGLDLLLDVASRFKKEKVAAFIIFIIADTNDAAGLYKKYENRIVSEKLEDYIAIFPKPISFVNLMQQSDVVVRATNTDGDALTVREALFFNKPIVVSDVTNRPEGSILFKNRNADDLYLKVVDAFKDKNEPEKTEEPKKDYKQIYVTVYEL